MPVSLNFWFVSTNVESVFSESMASSDFTKITWFFPLLAATQKIFRRTEYDCCGLDILTFQ